MKIWQSILDAVQSLSSNKMRSILTVLGIVIGVTAVIAMLAVGRGAQNTITGSIEGIGTNLLFITPVRSSSDVRNPKPLTLADAQAIGDPFQGSAIARTAPLLTTNKQVDYGSQSEIVTIYGVTPSYGPMRNDTVVEGEYISEEQNIGRSSVAVIGPTTADNLFGQHEGVVGLTVRIAGQPFRIIGVLGSKGGSSFNNEDDRIVVPITTAQTRLVQRAQRDQVDMILVESVTAESVTQASEEAAQVLRTRHRTAIGYDDFLITTQQDILSTMETITNVMTIFLGGIAAISLLVGGIGIMNIMLVSVTERTKEIGLRKAVGAHRSDILLQFLTESISLSLLGGIIGIGFGWGLSMLIGRIAAASGTPIVPVITLDVILLATLFSSAVGLFFGLYPANRAASLQPVEALRYE